MTSLYTILGLDRSATTEEIRRAYRKAAKIMHPDAGGDPQQFAALAQAADVLADPELRDRYDRTGEIGVDLNGPDAMAQEVLLGLLAVAVEKQMSPMLGSNQDMKSQMMAALNNEQHQIRESQKVMERRQAKLQDVAKSFKVKTGETDTLTPRILGMAAALAQQLEKMAADLAMRDRARVILERYDWSGEMQKQPQIFLQGSLSGAQGQTEQHWGGQGPIRW